MKRLILCSEQSKIDEATVEQLASMIPAHKFELDDLPTNYPGAGFDPDTDARRVYETDPKFFETFTRSIGGRGLDGTDGRQFAELRARMAITNQVVKITERCPVDKQKFIDEFKERILYFYIRRNEEKLKQAELKSQGVKQMSATSFAHKLIEERLGVRPSFKEQRWGDTYYLYMTYELPFADIHTGTIDPKKRAQFLSQFESLLRELKVNYDIWSSLLPMDGTIVRGAWRLSTVGPDILYNVRTKEARRAW